MTKIEVRWKMYRSFELGGMVTKFHNNSFMLHLLERDVNLERLIWDTLN